MQRRQKLLMCFMVGWLVIFYGTTATTALASEKIAKIALGSTVHVDIIDDVQDSLHIGSGFFVGPNQVATNYHVIEDLLIGESKLVGRAKLVGEEEIYIIEDIVAYNKEWDLAVVKVKEVKSAGIDVPPLPLGNSDTVRIGETIYVAGNPQGLEGTFTKGIISGLRLEGTPLVRGKVLQMDASISPGSSGGPVLNEIGKVIGISVGSRIDGQNLNFAIPVNYLKAIMRNTPTLVKPKRAKPKVESPPVDSKSIKTQAGPPPTATKLALTPQEIAKIALGSTVHFGIIHHKGGNTGSGFFVGPNQIATNYHVIEDILNEYTIKGAKLVGKDDMYAIEDIVDFDKGKDLAIVRVKGLKGAKIDVPVLPLGDSDTVQVGEKVYVAGNPEGLEGTFSDGIISAIRGGFTDQVFQMTAPISQGSSGGPVLNKKGEVIGVSVATSRDGQNLNFAIPVNYLKPLMPTLPPPVGPTSIPPTVKHVPPSKISSGEIIPLTVNIDSTQHPQQVTIHYKTYDRHRNELDPSYQRINLLPQQSASSTWIYEANLPSQKRVGSIEYYIEVEYENQVVFRYPSDRNRYYQVSIVDGEPPTISLLYPPVDAKFVANQEITFSAEVTDDIAVKDVHIHTSWFNGQKSHKLTAVDSSNIYTIDITFANIIILDYYLTATDEVGNESRSEPRRLEIRITPDVENLDRGINLYEQAEYIKAVEVLSAAIRELKGSREPKVSERRAEAYLYLGGATRGAGEGHDKVRGYFEESIRHNPNQELPPRLGKDHPIFAELIEEVRAALTGELTVISLLPQTEIWVSGTGTDRKMLGTGIVNSRLLIGRYTVEGIYEGGSKKKVVTIEPNVHKETDLEIPPVVEHDAPPRVSVDVRIPLTLDLISTKRPRQVVIRYTTYDRNRNELEESNQEMRLWAEQSESSMWVYKVDLPPQKQVGSIEYYVGIEYENHGVFEFPGAPDYRYQILIVDDEFPTISLLYPPDGEKVKHSQEIAIGAEVSASVPIKAVHVHFSAGNRQEMFQENYSDVYTTDITVSEPLRYYVTATDEAGNTSESESRQIGVTETPGPYETPPTIRLIKPYGDTSFKVNQRITIEAKVIDDTFVEQVHLVYSFSLDNHLFEPSHYSNLTEISADTYTGHIPPQSESGYIQYYVTATDRAGNTSQSVSRRIKISATGDGGGATRAKLEPPMHEGVWAGVSAYTSSLSNRAGGYMFRLAYLREGRLHRTLGAQLDVSYPDHRTNMSAMVQWEPFVKDSKVAFTLLGGIAAYEDAPRSIYMTPILGAGVQFYPRTDIVIDATGSVQFLPDDDTIDLYHYDVGVRFYITRDLGLRAGYRKLYLGDQSIDSIQVGLGITF